jgi:hypothetical protein
VRAFLGCATEPRETKLPVDLMRSGAWDPSDPRVDMIWRLCGETATQLGYARHHAGSAQERQ